MDNIQRQRGVLQNICLAMKGGVPSQTADGFIFFSSTSGEPLSFDSIMKWRKKVLSICHHIGGSLYIALCDRCNNYSAGAFVFCPYCSKDGNPVRLLHGCKHLNCWCNDAFFQENCSSFLVKNHIGDICCHKECTPYHGYPFVSPLECIVMLCISNYRTRLQNCRRSDLLFNALHCKHTGQINYAVSLNAASLLGYMGEFAIADRILEVFKEIVPVERMTNPLGSVFSEYFIKHQWASYFEPVDTPTPNPPVNTPVNTPANTPANTPNNTLFSSHIGDACLKNVYTIHPNGIASLHVNVMDALDCIVNDEKAIKENHTIRIDHTDIPGEPVSVPSEYHGPMFTEPSESAYDFVYNRVNELKTMMQDYPISIGDGQSSSSESSTIRFSYPDGERVEDMFFFVTLHADDKPTTPFSEKSLSHCIITLRILNGNPSDVNSPAFTHPLCIIPKPVIAGGDNHDAGNEDNQDNSWNTIVEGVFDAILIHTVAIGLAGVYISTPSGWKHVRWGVMSISGDTVGEEQISGYVNKSKSRFSCIYSSICKNDHFSPDNWIFCDMNHKLEKYNKELTCSSHALRCFNPSTAAANLGAVAGCEMNNCDSVFQMYVNTFPFLSDRFIHEATEISFFLNSFQMQNTVFWTPFSPSHPVLRQLFNAKIVQLQYRNIPRSGLTRDISLRFPINTHRLNDTPCQYLPASTILKDLAGFALSDKTIVNLPILRNCDIMWYNHPLIIGYGGRIPYCRRCIGPMDTLDYKPQWKNVCNLMLVPLQGVFAVDEMHLAANLIYWITGFLVGQDDNQPEFGVCFSNTIQHAFKTIHQCLLSLPVDIVSKANNRLTTVKRRRFPYSKYIILDKNRMRQNKIHDLIVFAFGCFDYIFQDSRSNFLVYCILEILNLFGILFTASVDVSDIMRVQSLLSFLLACIEGKTLPKSIPTVHRTSHLGDGILCTGSLSYVDNFYVEFSYSYLGKNLYQSRNPEVTCAINLRILSAVHILLGPPVNIPFYSSVTNAIDKISFPSTFVQINQFKCSLRSITKANVIDDHGFFCNQILYRHTFLDELIQGKNEAKQYCNSHMPSTFTFSIHSINNSFYRVCRWRDKRMYCAAQPIESITVKYLQDNEKSIVFTMNEKKQLRLYINMGFNLCFVNKIPYVQALCFPIDYETYHLLSSSSSSVYINPSFNSNVTQMVPRIISLYRLHMQEVRVLPNNNGSCYIALTTIYHSMSISMTDCWELQPDSARINYCYEYDMQLMEGIKRCKKKRQGKKEYYYYNNKELKKKAIVEGDLALNTKENELLKRFIT